MSQEQSKILQMLDEGKVTAEEATVLLKAMQSSTTQVPAVDSFYDNFRLSDWIKRIASIAVKQKVEEDLNWQLDSAGVQALAVQTVNGSIHYTGTDQQTITVHAHKIVRAPDLADAEAFAQQVQILSIIKDGTLHIHPEHPKPPRHVSVEVTLSISGPRTINVTGQSTNGNVQVQDVAGVVQVKSTNGETKVTAITGSVQAQTTNGNVSATALSLHGASEFVSQNGNVTVDVANGQPSIKASTINGSAHLSLPADYAGQLAARTQNGHVRTGFAVRTTQLARNRLTGQIGTGSDAQLELSSQNGNVTLDMATAA